MKPWREEIKAKRKEFKASQEGVANLVNVSREYYSRIESGKKKPSEELKTEIENAVEKFDPKYEISAIYDYVRIRFETYDYMEIFHEVLKMQFSKFIHVEYGFYSYREQYMFSGVTVMLADELDAKGNPTKKGTLIEMKGVGCRFFEGVLEAQGRTWNDFFCDCMKFECVFRRVDIAINDVAGILSIPELSAKVGTDECKSGFNSYQTVNSGKIRRQEEMDGKLYMGDTLYLGSFQSKVYFCIYEKDYEQYVKMGTPIEEAPIKNRFEIRLMEEYALGAIMDLITNDDIENTAFKIINKYVEFKKKDDKLPPKKWDMCYRWLWFIGNGRAKLKLAMQPEPYSLEKSERWIAKQVAPTLALAKKIDKLRGTNFVGRLLDMPLPDKQLKLYQQYSTDIKELIDIETEKKLNFDDVDKPDLTDKMTADEYKLMLADIGKLKEKYNFDDWEVITDYDPWLNTEIEQVKIETM